MQIDLNCDMGELPDAELEDTLMRHITSANIACGAHAGDALMMERTVRSALRSNVAVGAHPGYADRANFGRFEMPLTQDEIELLVFTQVKSLAEVTSRLGCEIMHVKPHGALYNVAVRDAQVAQAIGRGAARWSRDLMLVGLAGSRMLEVWSDSGFRVAAEAFVDRRYEPDGGLRSRKFPDALITDPREAAEQAVGIVREGSVIAYDGSKVAVNAQTLCIHSDTPDSVPIALQVTKQLRDAGIELRAFSHRL